MSHTLVPVADPGGEGEGAMPPGPVKISHKKDGCQRRLHRFRVSRPPPLYPATGSATAFVDHNPLESLANYVIGQILIAGWFCEVITKEQITLVDQGCMQVTTYTTKYWITVYLHTSGIPPQEPLKYGRECD